MSGRGGPCEEIRQKLGGFRCGDGLGLIITDLGFRSCFFFEQTAAMSFKEGEAFCST